MSNLSSLRITDKNLSTDEQLQKRQDLIKESFQGGIDGDSKTKTNLSEILDKRNLPDQVGQKNCENWVGSVTLPVGVAGPILIDSTSQKGKESQTKNQEYYIPLATTEGALVASVSRGAKAISVARGATVLTDKKGMTRAPVFECLSGVQAQELVSFLEKNKAKIKQTAESTSNHLKYLDHQAWVRGRHVYVRFVFDTDEAMGMNMTTIATQAVGALIEAEFKGSKLLALSSNACTDKKDNLVNSLWGRGWWAQAEIVLSEEVISKVLKTKIDKLLISHTQKNLIGSNLAGSFSQNAHTANVLAGIYLATGQDPAHVVEGSKAFLSLNRVEDGLYASLTLPNLNMGTVGGGTYLPSQKAARELIGLGREIDAKELVEVTAVACLAGELSLLASLSEHTLACAHQSLGR